MCIEFLSNSQQHFVDVLSGAKLIIELASTISAIGGSRWGRNIDVAEVIRFRRHRKEAMQSASTDGIATAMAVLNMRRWSGLCVRVIYHLCTISTEQ